MATNTDSSSRFRLVAIVIALLLICAAALGYLQAGGGSAASDLAALSQSIPRDASAALNGNSDGYANFDASVKRLAALRGTAGALFPGNAGDWRTL